MDVLWGGGRGGSKRKRPNDVVEEKIDMFVAPNENTVEDEQHFMTSCPKYYSLRTELYEEIEKSVKNFELLTPKQRFIFLMSCEDLQIIRWAAYYIKHATEIRSENDVNPMTWLTTHFLLIPL